MIRAFIAIEISPEAKKTLAELMRELIKSDADVKWVKPENIHLTLKFLGNITEEQQIKIQEILDKNLKDFNSFKIKLDGIGAFPKIEYPRVIWAGTSGEEIMKQIAKLIDEKVNKLGFPLEERSFKAHLTLGRVRSGKNKEKLAAAIKKLGNLNGPEFLVNNISLFQSTLTPTGSIYKLLHKTKFQN